MDLVEQHISRMLNWVPTAKHEYSLLGDSSKVATMTWRKGLGWLAEASDGRWKFQRRGIFRRQVIVRDAGSELTVATAQHGWDVRKTQVEFQDGRMFRWKPLTSWTSFPFPKEWELRDTKGRLVFRFRPGSKKFSGRVEIAEDALFMSQLSILMILGFYLFMEYWTMIGASLASP